MNATLPKTLLAVLLTGSLLSACAATAPGTARGGWATGEENVEDASLGADVRLALIDKLGFDALGVTVDTAGGSVYLTGRVEKRATQELAEEVALSVPGVTKVENRLSLKPTGQSETVVDKAVSNSEREVQDAALELRVGKNLLGEIGRHALSLEVESTDGVVSLRGRVPDRERKELALRAAQDTPGVKKVIDLIEVRR
ncbi:MAG TPA: BON domain-containing protein [Thermoanaerobaculia bacterium]|nr:BON domain-containing protein [Thermoanaerobaculia bacterium]